MNFYTHFYCPEVKLYITYLTDVSLKDPFSALRVMQRRCKMKFIIKNVSQSVNLRHNYKKRLNEVVRCMTGYRSPGRQVQSQTEQDMLYLKLKPMSSMTFHQVQ